MANEIAASLSIKYAKGKESAGLSSSFFATQVGDKYEGGVQSIGTSEEALAKGDVGTPGYVFVRNMDAVNFVQLGATTGVYSVKIAAGQAALIPWNGAAILAKADTAAVEVEYLIIEA